MNSTKQAPVHQAGFHISIWCRAVGISRASYYNLPPDLRPESVKIGRRHLVIEPPESYLRRIAKRAAEEKRKATSAAGADWEPLRGRTCCIVPDNDEPGA